MASWACTGGSGGITNLGGGDLGAGGGGIGTPPPATPPGGIGGPGDGGGGGGGGGGGSTTGGSAVPPLDAGIVGPSTDVGNNSNAKVSVDDVSICSFEDKVKIRLVGQAHWGNSVTGINYFENGRILRVVESLGKEFIESKITTHTTEGVAHILFVEKGHFDVTLILDHLPVQISNYPLAYSTIRFYMADEDYDGSGPVDEMQACPAQGSCFDPTWTKLEQPYFDQKLIEEAKTFKACGLGSLRHQAPIQLIQ